MAMTTCTSVANNISNDTVLMDSLPCDLVQRIANQYLNPSERARLSSCNRHFHKLLPPLLRIKIASVIENEEHNDANESGVEKEPIDESVHTNVHSLSQSFFVTPASSCGCDDDTIDTTTDFIGSLDHCLTMYDNLVYHQPYYFWTFDYERANKVFLGRHSRHSVKDEATGGLQQRFSMGLRPKCPNQTWNVTGCTVESKKSGAIVQWGDTVGLAACGNKRHPLVPDSSRWSFLSCLPPSLSSTIDGSNDGNVTNNNESNSIIRATWCAYRRECGRQERLQLLPIDHLHMNPNFEWTETELPIHAIPEACDEGEYLLYSPTSQRDGLATCDGLHVKVDFDFCIENGVMKFSTPDMSFSLAVPILETDYEDDNQGNSKVFGTPTSKRKHPIANLLDIKSARWGCLIYYMAVAADVSEGRKLDMNHFLQRVTDHPDHTVQVNEQNDYVYIDVRGGKVRTDIATDPTPASDNATAPWCFVLSW